MDSLSQIVLGAAVAEAVLGKKVGNKAAMWGAIAGTIPDLDVLGGIWQSELGSLISHRGFTHSILFSVIAAPILGWLIFKLYKEKEATWKGWGWLAFWALFTHPLLDCFTTWGTQLFYPFTDYRVALNTIFVVDPLYTIPFLVCLILALRLHREKRWRGLWNRIGIGISCFYLLLTCINKLTVNKLFAYNLHEKGQSTLQFSTYPTPFNNILWYVVAESPNSFNIGYYSLFSDKFDITFTNFPKNHQLLPDEENYVIDRMRWASKDQFTLEYDADSNLYWNDLRFGIWNLDPGSEPQFAFTYELIRQDSQFVDIRQINRGEEILSMKSLSAFWKQVLGN